MLLTPNLSLKKPAGTDVVDIADFNGNADILDAAVAAKETPAGAQTKVDTHANRIDNPHAVTAAQVGAIPTSQKGAANGVASLDASATIPDAQIPSTITRDAELVAHAALTTHKQVDGVVQSGLYSSAEGSGSIASGPTSHAEGSSATASGTASHAEGNFTLAKTDFSHAEGQYTLAMNGSHYNITAFDDVAKTITLGNYTTGLLVGDLLTIKIADAKAIEDIPITFIGGGSVMTLNTTATITANWKYAIEKSTTPLTTHAEGKNTVASGNNSHAEGDSTVSSGNVSHAEGSGTTSSGLYSHAQNRGTTAQGISQTTIGENNVIQGTTNSKVTTDNVFIIGNGVNSTTSRANAFRVTWAGAAYGLSAYNTTGADYSEFFEWLDANLTNEDRVGYFVTLDGERIRKANASDDYILGIVSSAPAIVGDSHNDDWQGRYVTDAWGRRQTCEIVVPAVVAEDGSIVAPEHTDTVFMQNPEWNPEETYIPRDQRKEWSTIGMLGKLFVRDDGTCAVNGYCKSNGDGIATASDVGYRVIKRVSDNIVQVLLKQ